MKFKGCVWGFYLSIYLLMYLSTLSAYIQLKKNDFEKIPLNSGSILSSGTHLSPYLRFGCLSPRVLWHFFTEAYEKVSDNLDRYLHLVRCKNVGKQLESKERIVCSEALSMFLWVVCAHGNCKQVACVSEIERVNIFVTFMLRRSSLFYA